MAQLKQLGELRDAGVLAQEEFMVWRNRTRQGSLHAGATDYVCYRSPV